jgi:arylformamidase
LSAGYKEVTRNRLMRIYDVTVPISEVMPVWPGDPRVKIDRRSSIADGDDANVSHLHLSSHTGTHVDAPYHFDMHGLTVDRLDPEVLVGPAFVAEADRLEGNTIQVYDLASLHLPKTTTRLLIKTKNSHLWEDRQIEFERDYVHLDKKSADWLVRRGIRLLGIDYLSVEAFQAADNKVHKTLLGSGMVVVEGLDLSRVPAGPCQVVCLPLKIEGGDGAPARVLVIRD